MRAVVQRVTAARVAIDGRTVGEIGPGVVVLLGVAREDTAEEGQWLAEKIAKLRIFADADGAMNRSLVDTHGDAMVVSQFTLHARTRKGSRPSFNDAAPPDPARELYTRFLAQLESALCGRRVARGEFGAMMQVSLTYDGPVTIIVDTAEPK